MGDRFVILVLYVDDILLIGDNIELVRSTKSFLSKSFDMKDLSAMHYCLDIKLKRDGNIERCGLVQRIILKTFSMIFEWGLVK
jgi:hypothetical protein